MKLYEKVECENCARFPLAKGRCWVEGCMGDGWRLKKLDPADLATLFKKKNLTAGFVLEKVKEYLEGAVDMHLVGIRNLIRNLESNASQEEKEPEMKGDISTELYVRYKCSGCMEPELWPECKGCADICRKYREATPADLLAVTKKLEAGYYGLVEEFRKDMEEAKAKDPKYKIAPSTILKALDYMESGLSIPEAVIEAAAWKIVAKRGLLKKEQDRILAQARADLEAGRDTGKDK